MKNSRKILLNLTILLIQANISYTQVRYWDFLYENTNQKHARYFSTEIKENGYIYRTFFSIKDSSKIRFQKKTRSGKLLELISYYPEGGAKWHRYFSKSGKKYRNKTFDREGNIRQEFTFDEYSSIIHSIFYDKKGNKILDVSPQKTLAFFSNGNPRKLLGNKQQGNFIHYYDNGNKMLSQYYREGKAVQMLNSWTQDGQINSFDRDQFVQFKQSEPVNFPVVNKAIRNSPEILNNEHAGKVVIRMYVQENGLPITYRNLYKVSSVLSNAVERYILYLRFEPFIQEGETRPFWVDIPFYFKGVN